MLNTTRPATAAVYDLHPMYASILADGMLVTAGEVLGLDADLRRALVAPFDGSIRLRTVTVGNRTLLRVFLKDETASRP